MDAPKLAAGQFIILKTFNDEFGNIAWTHADWVHRLITKDIPAQVAADAAYRSARRNSDRQNGRIEHMTRPWHA